MTIIVALIAASAALIGATIAAVTAGRRQQRQLDHDRQLADVTELRAVLDEAAGNLADAERAMQTVQDLLTAGRKVTDQAKANVSTAQDALTCSARRVRIRLGEEGPYGPYQDALDAELRFRASTVDRAPAGGDPTADMRTHRAAFIAARDEYFQAAHRVVGSHIGPDPRR
ncbi:hypothetical protein [Actinoplanes sp. ATCC 53533]|uniref:hypothetical protein n=1 Tax=Actinoplanes sp. ATCC 53533 TaxID=1288362 RepID=UPI000F76DFC0|nr:hypothetical protein [Actinoplanes sp. ATCC 53533]